MRQSRGGFAVTPEGKIVYDSTTQLLVALEEFRSQVNAFHSELVGELYVGCIDGLVASEGSLMPTILADYVAAHPSVRFNMIVGSASEMDRAVEERRLRPSPSSRRPKRRCATLKRGWRKEPFARSGRRRSASEPRSR